MHRRGNDDEDEKKGKDNAESAAKKRRSSASTEDVNVKAEVLAGQRTRLMHVAYVNFFKYLGDESFNCPLFLFFKDVMLFTDFDGQLTDFSRNVEATFQKTVFKNRLRPDSSFTAYDLYS